MSNVVTILIDNREKGLIELLGNDPLKHVIMPLDVGDIQIKVDDQILFVYERKTIEDLAASIQDGRYREQKARLISLFPSMGQRHRITYIIEDTSSGRTSKGFAHMSEATFRGMILNTMYRDGIHVMLVNNKEATWSVIVDMANRIANKPALYLCTQGTGTGQCKETSDYIDSVKAKTKKIDNIDQLTCFQLQLAQIPSISTGIAKIISEQYKNMSELITALQQLEIKEQLALLTQMKLVGAKKAHQILTFLGL